MIFNIYKVPRTLPLILCMLLGTYFAFAQTTDSLKRLALDSNVRTYPVLHGYRNDTNQVAAIGYLKGGNALTSTPTAYVYNALSGRLAGLNVSLNNGMPGSDNATLSLRGLAPLILVDGVPRFPSGINPEQIESITLLKDALSTAMLGMQGANGALLITTRSGRNTRGYTFDATVQTGVSSSLQERKPLSAFDYATLYNEALVNDGRVPIYSSAALQGYKDQNNRFLYPNVDWSKELFKDNAPFSRYTINSEGSGKNINYFVSLDYLNQQGLLKENPANTYKTNTNFERFVFRTNLEMDLTPRLKGTLNLYSNIGDQNAPGNSFATLYSAFLNTPANAYPKLNPNGSLGGNILFSNNMYGQAVFTGYTKTNTTYGFADLGLKREMDDVLEGLWVKGRLAYNFNTNQFINRSKAFQTFQMNVGLANDTTYQRYGTQSSQVNTSAVTDRGQQIYMEGSGGYTHKTGDNTFNALLIYTYQNLRSTSQLAQKYNNAALQLSYNVQNKYIFEGAASYSGNSWFKPGNQYGFYPSVGFSWNVDQESFFAKDGFLNALKLRTTYGKVGNADPGYFTYRYAYINTGSAYYFGTGPGAVQGSEESALPSVRMASSALKFDAGLDLTFAKNRAFFTVDYYNHAFANLLQIRGQASALLGIAYPLENLGKSRTSGTEWTAGWADKVGSLGYTIGANLSFNNSKIIDNNEPAQPYPWMAKTGQPVNQVYGYLADGFVSTAGQGPVVEGYTSLPGDIKYKDLNGDGVINQYDVTAIGGQKPLIYYGFNVGINYKNFDLSVLFQGVEHNKQLLTGLGEWAFQNNGTGNAFEQHLNRWTPQTAATATYPRLSVGPNRNNNTNSSFWVNNFNYLRLKNVAVGYNLSTAFLNKISVKQIRFFVNGFNLATLSKTKRIDPESLSLGYPIQEVINGGITVKF